MALLFMDSFDHYSTAHLFRKWTSDPATQIQFVRRTIEPTGGRCASGCLKVVSYTNSISEGPFVAVSPAGTSGCVGVGVRIDTFATRYLIFRITYGGSGNTETHLSLEMTSDGHLWVNRGLDSAGVVLEKWGPTTLAMQSGSYYFLEFKFTIHASAGAFEVWANGQLVLSQSGINTKATSPAAAWNGVVLGRMFSVVTSSQMLFDDFYVADDSGAVNNSRLGDIHVEAILPQTDAIAIGTHHEWTPSSGTGHGALVDENPADDDTSYVFATTVGVRDTFKYRDMAILSGTVLAVSVLPMLRKDDSTTKECKSIVRVGSTNYLGPTKAPSLETYRYHPHIFEQNPAGGGWTVAIVNAAEFGQQLTV